MKQNHFEAGLLWINFETWPFWRRTTL